MFGGHSLLILKNFRTIIESTYSGVYKFHDFPRASPLSPADALKPWAMRIDLISNSSSRVFRAPELEVLDGRAIWICDEQPKLIEYGHATRSKHVRMYDLGALVLERLLLPSAATEHSPDPPIIPGLALSVVDDVTANALKARHFGLTKSLKMSFTHTGVYIGYYTECSLAVPAQIQSMYTNLSGIRPPCDFYILVLDWAQTAAFCDGFSKKTPDVCQKLII